ncbi:hypothetical protein MANES_12G143950v8 [Manihot esculenta]|uniref:Uncharacterized protein n=1 Tax=Manihot esculenta TaxID=3983 RepID=A0ACB7GRC0_MANES|nr:hypothetical protein MANES_12G143950v8 [Manihot esculenta]
MTLVTAPLVGFTFRTWNRAVRIAFGAKMKLGFVEGIVSAPSKKSKDYEQWKRCDFMVTSWILNSISKELVDGFVYTASGRDLWLEISKRFGECNGLMVHELHRKISPIAQENASVSDKLGSMETLPACTCGASRAIAKITNRNKFMQFLMGLNEVFGSVRDQNLRMDPLPTEVLKAINDNSKSLVLLSRSHSRNQTRFRKLDTKKAHCTHCNMDGHTREGCFKLIGYPDWFKSKNRTETHLVRGSKDTKMAILPFPKSQTLASKPFDLIHIDIWGPYKTNSIIGARFFLTIVDDYSKAV